MPDAALSPNPNTFLLEGVSPTVRRILVKERIRALQGGIDGALKSLEDAIALVKNDHPRDAIALGLLQAELLHLELRDDEALAVMEKVVIPLMPFLTAAEGFGVEQNRSDLQLFSPGGDTALFYNIVDQKR